MLNWAVRPSSSSSVSLATLSAKICSVTWPPPASSAQWPALAAAATIAGSTVVGVMPASRIGDLPVRRVKAVSTTGEPSPRSIRRGAWVDQSAAVRTSAPAVKRTSRPFSVAAGMTVMPRPRRARPVRLAERSDGPRSTTKPVSAAHGVVQLTRPVDGLDADGVREVLGEAGVQAAGLGPGTHHGDGGGE